MKVPLEDSELEYVETVDDLWRFTDVNGLDHYMDIQLFADCVPQETMRKFYGIFKYRNLTTSVSFLGYDDSKNIMRIFVENNRIARLLSIYSGFYQYVNVSNDEYYGYDDQNLLYTILNEIWEHNEYGRETCAKVARYYADVNLTKANVEIMCKIINSINFKVSHVETIPFEFSYSMVHYESQAKEFRDFYYGQIFTEGEKFTILKEPVSTLAKLFYELSGSKLSMFIIEEMGKKLMAGEKLGNSLIYLKNYPYLKRNLVIQSFKGERIWQFFLRQ